MKTGLFRSLLALCTVLYTLGMHPLAENIVCLQRGTASHFFAVPLAAGQPIAEAAQRLQAHQEQHSGIKYRAIHPEWRIAVLETGPHATVEEIQKFCTLAGVAVAETAPEVDDTRREVLLKLAHQR